MKKSRIVSLALAAMLCLSACAKTPEAPVVVQKNKDRLIEKATSEDEDRKPLQEAQEETPSDYSFHYQSEDGKVTISAEADVLLPETERIPMYQVSCQGFPQEQVTAIYDYLFQGESTWYDPDNWYCTKAMADADLEDMRRELERLRVDTEMDPDRKKNLMDTLQEMIDDKESFYNSYPAEMTKVPRDSTYQIKTYDSVYGPGEYQELYVRTDSGKSLLVHSYTDRDAYSILRYKSQTGYKYTCEPTTSAIANYNNPVPYDSDVPFSCAYSYEEAKALADGLFLAAGVDVRLIQTEILQGAWDQSEWYENQSIADDDVHNAYLFCYSRVIGGIPVAATTSEAMYVEDNNPCWLYERIYVTVDSGGISNVKWDFPVTCGDAVNEDVNILPFDEAKRVFEEMAPLIYQGQYAEGKGKTQLTVDRVELNLMRTRDGGGLTGLYVPTWVFYGTQDFGREGFTGEQILSRSPWIILAVNAVDGSIIDVKAGY